MHEGIRFIVPEAEFYTQEGCFINELSNIDVDPEASIARVRVPVGTTTRYFGPAWARYWKIGRPIMT